LESLNTHTHTHTTRLIVIGMLTPILTHIGYQIDWKQATVITWGGLRGAVGLSLALVVAQTSGGNIIMVVLKHNSDPQLAIGDT